ncbi:hypothetical protein ACFOJE_20875 [Azotobacter bryophylli]|uniref:Uncharacterized protein n=1 Tax=Azotobacter bryophylli TaxID=1986537 RepID=A0ABV7AYU5_9GAMM
MSQKSERQQKRWLSSHAGSFGAITYNADNWHNPFEVERAWPENDLKAAGEDSL